MTPEHPAGAVDTPLAEWLRGRLAARDGGKLLGRGYQASVHLYDSPYGEIVVKEAHPGGLLGLLGRRSLRHEWKVYARLGGVPGTLRCFGLLDGRYLILEHVPGPSLRARRGPLADPNGFYARLLETLDAMHAAGVAHGDLKRKNNVLVGPGERPYVIDFGVAWRCGRSSPAWRRAVFALVAQMDYNAWIKHKHGRPPYGSSVPQEDRARYRPLLLERLARAARVSWQTLTLRRLRKRLRSNGDRAS